MSEREVLMRKIEDAIEGLPAKPDRPIEELTVPELLVENVREGLLQSHRILSQPMKLKQTVDDELSASDIRLQRVISDTAAGQAKLLAHIQEAELRGERSSGKWQELLENIKKFKAEDGANGSAKVVDRE